MSFRDVDDLLAERGIVVSYETIRVCCQKFSSEYTQRLKRHQGRLGDFWHLDEVFIRINGQQQYLWELWIKTAKSSTSWCSRAAINARRDASFEDFCGTKEESHFELLATNYEVTRLPYGRFLAK